MLSPMASTKTQENLVAVVDDDERLGRSLERFLKASGFQSVIYLSAESFLGDKQRPQFGCLIVDLQLGGISGIDLRDSLKSAGVNVPMILMTARDEKEIDRHALQADGTIFLRKSDPGEALLAALHRLVHRCQHQEQVLRDSGNA